MSRELTCEYCHGACTEGATKCASCGAPLGEAAAPDVRYCPYCQRRLLALGSPACNYCGRALPAHYVKAREAMWQRIHDASEGASDERDALEQESDEAMRRALKALFDLKRERR